MDEEKIIAAVYRRIVRTALLFVIWGALVTYWILGYVVVRTPGDGDPRLFDALGRYHGVAFESRDDASGPDNPLWGFFDFALLIVACELSRQLTKWAKPEPPVEIVR